MGMILTMEYAEEIKGILKRMRDDGNDAYIPRVLASVVMDNDAILLINELLSSRSLEYMREGGFDDIHRCPHYINVPLKECLKMTKRGMAPVKKYLSKVSGKWFFRY